MCGIAGILLAANAADPSRLSAIGAMADTLIHRGPDDAGTWLDSDAGIVFAHRRLAIVDLSAAGKQPMLSHSESLVMTFNGEVYNFFDLKTELEAQGHQFRGHGDTEVMLGAFEQSGVEKSVPRFTGMFAFAVWDRRRRVLHLVRDRMGKKPLYIALSGGALLFASELKAIRAYPGFRSEINAEALALMLRHGWVPDQHCIFQNVFKLPPGTMLSIKPENLNATSIEKLRQSVKTWWSLAEIAESGQRQLFEQPAEELETQLEQLLGTVVRDRMVADVPLGAFLSGGIDSTAIVALMQSQSSRPIRTFTIGFSEAQYDESRHASQVAHHLGTEHTEFYLTPAQTHAVIPDLPQIWDEPFADESQIPTLLLTRLARQHVTVALSGDGGDECFGGYTRHIMLERMKGFFSLPAPLRRTAVSALQILGQRRWEKIIRALPVGSDIRAAFKFEGFIKWSSVLDAADEQDLYDRLITLAPQKAIHHTTLRERDRIPNLRDTVSHLIYRDMTDYLPSDILVKVDRASMAASMEARSPFLDHRMVEFCWRLPTALKIRNGTGKWLLQNMLRRYLPMNLFERPKHGFNVPIRQWLIGPLRDWTETLLDEQTIRHEGLLDPVAVRACWHEHLIGTHDHSRELWAVLMARAWLETIRSPHRAPSYSNTIEINTETSPPPTPNLKKQGALTGVA